MSEQKNNQTNSDSNKHKINTSLSIAKNRKKWALGTAAVLFCAFVYFVTNATDKKDTRNTASQDTGGIQFSDPNTAEQLWSALATQNLENLSSDVSMLGKELTESQKTLAETQAQLAEALALMSGRGEESDALKKQLASLTGELEDLRNAPPASSSASASADGYSAGGAGGAGADGTSGTHGTAGSAGSTGLPGAPGRPGFPGTAGGMGAGNDATGMGALAAQDGSGAVDSRMQVFRRQVPPPSPDSTTQFVRPRAAGGVGSGSGAFAGSGIAGTAEGSEEEAGPLQMAVWTPPGGDEGDSRLGTKKYRYVKNPMIGWLPMGSFFQGTLLHGLDAGTGSNAQANPQPVLIRVMGNAFLPNEYRYQVKSCFIMGASYGSLSSERAYIRTTQLSCVGDDGKAVINAPIRGYAVDNDGKLGLRGKLVNRQGAKLAGAMLAGFASGISSAFSSAAGSTTYTPYGSTRTIDTGDAMQAAGFGGMANATDELAKFYIDAAKEIFPVIVVNSGRNITVTLEQGLSLKWQPTDVEYIPEETTPNPIAVGTDGSVERRSGSLSEFGRP